MMKETTCHCPALQLQVWRNPFVIFGSAYGSVLCIFIPFFLAIVGHPIKNRKQCSKCQCSKCNKSVKQPTQVKKHLGGNKYFPFLIKKKREHYDVQWPPPPTLPPPHTHPLHPVMFQVIKNGSSLIAKKEKGKSVTSTCQKRWQCVNWC